MSQLPHKFIPTQRMLEQSISGAPSGAIEMFLVACNVESDMKHDASLAKTSYKPRLSELRTEPSKQENKLPFSVPISKSGHDSHS
jgi:hypothetical protein